MPQATTTTTTTTLPAPLRPHALAPRSDVAYVPDFVSEREEEALLRHLKPPAAGADAAAGWRALSGRRLKTLGGSVDRGALTAAPLPSWLLPLIERLRLTGAYAEEGGGRGQGGDGEKPETKEGFSSSSKAPTSLASTSTSSSSPSASSSPSFPPPPPNHALVNCYRSGEGILPHEDGPCYHPAAAIVSLGSWAVLRFYSKRGSEEDDDDDDGEEERKKAEVEEKEQEEEGKGSTATARTNNVFSVALAPRSLVVFAGEAYQKLLHGIEAVAEEALDASVLNRDDEQVRRSARERAEAAAGIGGSFSSSLFVIPRGGESAERVSLTVRRVLRVRRNLLRLGPR